METIMADIIILFLFLGGFVGWCILTFVIYITMICRSKELIMIENISKELKKIKEEIAELK